MKVTMKSLQITVNGLQYICDSCCYYIMIHNKPSWLCILLYSLYISKIAWPINSILLHIINIGVYG